MKIDGSKIALNDGQSTLNANLNTKMNLDQYGSLGGVHEAEELIKPH